VLGTPATEEGFGDAAIAVDANGNINVAWVNRSPIFRRSTNNGSSFSDPVAIPPENLGGTNAPKIQMGLDALGDIHLLWTADLTGTGQTLTDFFSRSVDGGQSFSEPIAVATTTAEPGTRARLVVQPDGTIIIVWFDQTTSNLFASSSTDGVNFSAPILIWTAAGTARYLASGVGSQGQIYVLWTQTISSDNCAILFSSSTDGATFSPAASISDGSGACNIDPQVLVDANDNVNVSWHADGTSLFFTRSQDSGVTFSPPASVPTGPIPLATLLDQHIAVGPDDTIYIAWSAASHGFLSSSTDGGTTFSVPTPLSLGTLDSPFVAVDPCNDVSVVGQGDAPNLNILLQQSTDSGVTFSSPITLSNTFGNFTAKLATDPQGNLNVVYDVDGPPLLVYVREPTSCCP